LFRTEASANPSGDSQICFVVQGRGTLSAVARCTNGRGKPHGETYNENEIARHSSRECSNSRHQCLCAEFPRARTGSQARAADGWTAANQRSKNNHGPGACCCSRCRLTVRSKRWANRHSKPRSSAGRDPRRRQHPCRQLTEGQRAWCFGSRRTAGPHKSSGGPAANSPRRSPERVDPASRAFPLFQGDYALGLPPIRHGVGADNPALRVSHAWPERPRMGEVRGRHSLPGGCSANSSRTFQQRRSGFDSPAFACSTNGPVREDRLFALCGSLPQCVCSGHVTRQ
jgi:hypothetical protein